MFSFILISNNIKSLFILLVIVSIIKYIFFLNLHHCIFKSPIIQRLNLDKSLEKCDDVINKNENENENKNENENENKNENENENIKDKLIQDNSMQDNIINFSLFMILNKLFWLMVYDYYNV